MASILTDHVRHYGTAAAAREVLGEIRRLLRGRMRRAGLLLWSPAQLGYPDVRTWDDRDAFDDITQDCYLFAVAGRIEGLRRGLRDDQDIDPLIIRNIRNFLAERQRENNPIGYAVYQNVRAAVLRARDDGWLTVERGPDESMTASLLSFGHGAGTLETDALARQVAGHPDVAKIGRTLSRCAREAQDWVYGLLEALRERGSGPMRLRDLVAVLESRAREAWPANAPPASETVSELDEEDEAVLVRIIPADDSVADLDQYRALVARAEQALRELPQKPDIRARRLLVLAAILDHAEESNGAPLRQVDLARKLNVNQVTLCRDVEAIREIFLQIREKE
jgi:hypothetical protein